MSDQNEERQKRGEVIEKTINIEVMIDAIICQKYFGRVIRSFMFEVLNDEWFSLGLKIRILEKILPNPDKQRLQDLRRLSTIRNHFAHCNLVYVAAGEKEQRVLDPRKPDRDLDLGGLYNEFCLVEATCTPYLAQKYEELGGEMHKESPAGGSTG